MISTIYDFLLIYGLLMTLFTFILFGKDKRRARQGKRRIPEFRLLCYALLGGSVGALGGIYYFRHKTRHLKFTWGLPLIVGLQTGIIFYIVRIL